MRRNRLILALSVSALLFLAGCGGGASAPKFAAPPAGSYTNANFSGAYAFSVSGANQSGFLALAGNVQADGHGSITSGIADVNGIAGVSTNVPISGTYSVTADGRGTATLNAASINSVFTIDFVIVSSTRALAVRFDPNSSASGSFDKQDSSAFFLGAINGQYAFTLSGIGATGNTYQSAGLFAANGGGTLNSGLLDLNSNGAVSTSLPLTGTYTVGGASGRGTLSLLTSLGAQNFAFYVVDATHLKLIEIDGAPVLSGDAYSQNGPFSNAALNGPFAFTLGGGLSGPFAAGGVFTGNNGTITTGVEDFNSTGSIVQNASTTGTYSVAANGRGTLTLTNSAGTFNFAVYPSTGGLLMMGLDSSLPESGAAFLQTGLISATPNASISGDYGYNLTGVNLSNFGQVDAIAHLSANGSGQFTGSLDFNLMSLGSGLQRGLAFNGPYTLGSNGRGTATLTSSNGSQNFGLYFVSPSRVLFIELDSGLTALGDIEAQR